MVDSERVRVRREPPRFRRAQVESVQPRGPRMHHVVLTGRDLVGMETPDPAASVRLLLPDPATGVLEMPSWNGNEFLRTDGSRPAIRTFTPLELDPDAGRLALDVVVHDGGAASAGAAAAQPGAPPPHTGARRGYPVDAEARSFLLAGDESAIPAIGQLLEVIAPAATVAVLVELSTPEARLDLPAHPGARITWADRAPGSPPGQALRAAVASAPLAADTRIWVAGEAASVQGIRRLLFEERGVERGRAVVRGYWKVGRAGDDDPASVS